MMGRTHLAFGLLAALLVLPFTAAPQAYLLVPLVLFGAVLPDVDHEGSFINKRLPVTRWIPWLFQHRGFFHSVMPVVVMAGVAVLYGHVFVGLAIALGYMVHLATDAFTRSGVRFFYPAPLRLGGPFATGGLAENMVFVGIIAIDCLLIVRMA